MNRDWADEMCDIAECELCDQDGVRINGIGKCDHIDWSVIAKRGLAKVRAVLEAKNG